MIHGWRTSERVVETPTQHKPLTAMVFKSRCQHVFSVFSSSDVCFVYRAQSFLDFVGTVLSLSVLLRQCWIGKSLCVASRTSNTPWFCGPQKTLFTELGAFYLGQVDSGQFGSFSFLIDKKGLLHPSSLPTSGREEVFLSVPFFSSDCGARRSLP